MCDNVSIGNVVYATGAKLATKGVSIEKLWNVLPDKSRKQAGKWTFMDLVEKKQQH